jgi:hypothetical protein
MCRDDARRREERLVETTRSITLLDGESDGTFARELVLPATIAAGAARVPAEAVARDLGWELKPEGLCRGDVCVPVREEPGLATDAGLDLAALARTLDRPLALDLDEGAASLGASARERAAPLARLEAPDFELPDMAGRPHRLSAHRGKKVLLTVHASW